MLRWNTSGLQPMLNPPTKYGGFSGGVAETLDFDAARVSSEIYVCIRAYEYVRAAHVTSRRTYMLVALQNLCAYAQTTS